MSLPTVRKHCPQVRHVVAAARMLGKPKLMRPAQRVRILEAALEMVRSKGFGDFTLQAVGAAAGCSYNGVRNYWANRRLLLADLAAHAEDKGELGLAGLAREMLK